MHRKRPYLGVPRRSSLFLFGSKLKTPVESIENAFRYSGYPFVHEPALSIMLRSTSDNNNNVYPSIHQPRIYLKDLGMATEADQQGSSKNIRAAYLDPGSRALLALHPSTHDVAHRSSLQQEAQRPTQSIPALPSQTLVPRL